MQGLLTEELLELSLKVQTCIHTFMGAASPAAADVTR